MEKKINPVFAEKDYMNRELARTPEDIMRAKTQYVGTFGGGGGDALSDVLSQRLQSAYSGQLQSIKDRFGRQAIPDAAQMAQTGERVIQQNYADVLRAEAEAKAREMAKKAKRKGQIAALSSIAGAGAGAMMGGPLGGAAGAQIGGGVGGLIGGS